MVISRRWVAKFMGTEINELYFNIIVGIAVYFALLLLVPASIIGNAPTDVETGANRVAEYGAYLYLTMLWSLGWGFLWLMLNGGDESAVANVPMVVGDGDLTWTSLQLMTRLPPGFAMWITLLSTAYEGYQYSGFSFFPALPWNSIEVPPNVPSPASIFLAGLLELPGDKSIHYATFLGACFSVLLSFILLSYFSYKGDTGKVMVLIEIAFSSLSFPIIKQLTDVFACTRGDLLTYKIDSRQVGRLCGPNVKASESCMDAMPDAVCWSEEHIAQVLVVMVVLTAYYMAALYLRTEAQAKSSAVILDGVYCVVIFQLKMILAVVATMFGDCHPLVIVVTVEVIVLSMLAMSTIPLINKNWFNRMFSNVVSLNVVRTTALSAAVCNGFFAAYITAKHKGGGVCWAAGAAELAAADAGTLVDPSGGVIPAGGPGGPDGTGPTRQVQHFGEFLALCAINGSVILIGIVYFLGWSRTLNKTQKSTLETITGAPKSGDDIGSKNAEQERAEGRVWSHQVELPAIQMRLYAEAQDDFVARDDESWPGAGAGVRDGAGAGAGAGGGFKIWASEEKQNEAERLGGPAEGQQIHEMTLKLLLFNHQKMASTFISFHDVDIRTEGGTKLRTLLASLIPPEDGSWKCTKVQKLERKVAIHFADKSGGVGQGDYKGCSLAKLKDFETGVKVHIPAAYKALASKGQKDYTLLQAGHESLVRTRSSTHLHTGASSAHLPVGTSAATGAQIPSTTPMPKLLEALITRIVDQDQRVSKSLVEEQARSFCSWEVNRQRLDVLYDLLRVPWVEHLDISGCGFQNVFWTDSAGDSDKSMCVENRGLLLEDLLRSAVAIYQTGDSDLPPAVSLSSLFLDEKETSTWVKDRDDETIVVNCGRCVCGGSGGGRTPSVRPPSECTTCGCCGVRQLTRGKLWKAVGDLKVAYTEAGGTWGNGDSA